jgi:hypothetical protein
VKGIEKPFKTRMNADFLMLYLKKYHQKYQHLLERPSA